MSARAEKEKRHPQVAWMMVEQRRIGLCGCAQCFGPNGGDNAALNFQALKVNAHDTISILDMSSLGCAAEEIKRWKCTSGVFPTWK
ncbi:hypothetical protein Hypma_005610 [Hypsizygus marmoreus]|uniref:Uncharacterized protein n=1 Tax=Hypsizygus marmoreus TaxID=39966 RepID=A0A369K1C6_HYPMA|nr:hypothetical protein Hypma_005610 [Hypsizygus marmoreus]